MDLNLFTGWDRLAVVLLKTLILYCYVILLLRVGGKRTMGKIATFDFVSIIIMGPLVATTILSSTVALADGLAALTGFVALQWLVSYMSTRSKRFAGIVTAPPSLLFSDTGFVRKNVLAQRVHEDEIAAAIRAAGHATTDSVKAVVLESTGEISIIASSVPDNPVTADELVLGSVERQSEIGTAPPRTDR
ncbi:MAG: hypothetical protein M3Q29_04820 [Chloroflexota bacterium]|nr:hypothetical protein [Chloroflexota bacterium]